MKVPFENRIVLLGYDLALAGYTVHNKERLKNAVKNFQFSPDPAKLKEEYRKIFNAQPTGFGVIDATTMRVNPEDGFFTCAWIQGGTLGKNVYEEEIDDYFTEEGRFVTLCRNACYYVFMTGTGQYLCDTEEIYGNADEYRRLLSVKPKYEISSMLEDMLRKKMLEAGSSGDEYIDLDDIIL